MPNGDGFTADITEMDKAARYPGGSLPHAIELLRDPVSTLIVHEGFEGSGRFDATDRLQVAYRAWGEVLGQRLERACEVMDANAEALRDIIALYRRVDGQS
jgi:hypothetical protein